MTLVPSLLRLSWGISSMRMIRSPGTPPRGAAFPFPLMESCIPSLTPAGMLMLMVSSPRTKPSPWQAGHLAEISIPSPLQVGQVLVVCIWPRMVLVTLLTVPVPPHVRQLWKDDLSFAPLPSQVLQTTCLLTLIFFSDPLAISCRVSFTLIRRLDPLATRRPPPRWPPPKKLSNGLPPPNMSPNWLNISSIFMPPPPPKLLAEPEWPKRSYRCRFSGLLSTSYASAASLNFSSASALFGFLSG